MQNLVSPKKEFKDAELEDWLICTRSTYMQEGIEHEQMLKGQSYWNFRYFSRVWTPIVHQ